MIARLVHGIDTLSELVGKAVSWLLVVLIAEVFYDVVMRYAFSAPTVWSYDVSYMLGGAVILMASAWVLKRGEHISMDVISQRFTVRTRLVLDVVFLIAVFFPLTYVLMEQSLRMTMISVMNNETSSVSFWRPVYWPFRIAISAGLVLLLAQGVSNLIRKCYALLGREL